MVSKEVDVSVVVCTLNEEKRIKACLEHLRNQKFSGTVEIIVADGYSDDKTVAIAKPLADKIVLEKVRRISAERQAGAKAAKGKIIAFTDADSKAPSDWIQKIWGAFEKNKKAVFVYGPITLHDVSKSEQKWLDFLIPVFLRFQHTIGMASPVGSNIAITKKAFEKINGFDTTFVTCEDLDLARRAKKVGKLVLDASIVMPVSGRRVKKWGYIQFSLFHLVNAFRFHVLGRAARKYEDIR